MNMKMINGLPVADATMAVTIHVTKRDISGADPKVPGQCAIARACRRQFEVTEARVHLSRTYLCIQGQVWLRYETPKAARSEIIAFDRGGTFEPVHFDLVPPRPSNNLGVDKRARTGERTGKKKTKKAAVTQNVRAGPRVSA